MQGHCHPPSPTSPGGFPTRESISLDAFLTYMPKTRLIWCFFFLFTLDILMHFACFCPYLLIFPILFLSNTKLLLLENKVKAESFGL